MEHLKHFKNCVPVALQHKIKEVAEYVRDYLISEFNEPLGCARISEIQGNFVSGWWPHQEGGFDVSEMYSNNEDSTCHFCKEQTDFNAGILESVRKDYCTDNGLCLDSLSDEQQQELDEREYDALDPALLRFQIFTEAQDKEAGGFIVTMRLSVGFKDSPYYREKYDHDLAQLEIDSETLVNSNIPQLIQSMVDKVINKQQ